MSDIENHNPPPAVLACPHCYKPIAAQADDAGDALVCPHCGGEFTLPSLPAPAARHNGESLTSAAGSESPDQPDGFFVVDDTSSPPAASITKNDELDSMHIRSITHLRRTAMRSRSYMLVLMIASVVLAGECIRQVVKTFSEPWTMYKTGYALAAVVLVWWATRFWAKAQAFGRESRTSLLQDPTTPPDLSQLSDGSQAWNNLHKTE